METPHQDPIQNRHLLDLNPEQMQAALVEDGFGDVPAYRVQQILQWVYGQKVESFEQMSNLPAEWRRRLAEKYALFEGRVVQEQTASDGTHKLLLGWRLGGTSECVLIPDPPRMTACISTQVGCPVQCAFCASGVGGLERNLAAGEIVEQALHVARLCVKQGRRLSNVVFMGLGEPLANYDATLRAVRCINADWGLNIGARKITISTVGLPSRMKQLADEGLQITLALSLHAPTDELRQQLIPWAKRVTIDELTEACRYYFSRTGREVTLEYILLEGVNNLPYHAVELARISKQMRSNVNLIAYNPVADLGFSRPSRESVLRFEAALRERGVNTHVRRSRGLDIDAACGQLRRREASLVKLLM